MSTRGYIARSTGPGAFSGRYHGWDSMPTSLGKSLWDMYNGHFKQDLKKMLTFLLDKHPAGWSTLVGKNLKINPGYTNVGDRNGMPFDEFYALPKNARPQCYCHGDRHEGAQEFTEKDLEGTDAEWLYVFHPDLPLLVITDLNHDSAAILVDLKGDEPDWDEIQCGRDFSRCIHVAKYHNLGPEDSNMSTQTWLGKRELEFHDVIRVEIAGKVYKMTGSGGDANFMGRVPSIQKPFERYPDGTWLSSVKTKNGKRLDLPTAIQKDGTHVPYPGVTWIYPPTAVNPNETKVSA
jgi:hypothetical protein